MNGYVVSGLVLLLVAVALAAWSAWAAFPRRGGPRAEHRFVPTAAIAVTFLAGVLLTVGVLNL